MYTTTERESMMVAMHGEVCNRTVACKILSCSASSLRTMLGDGRIEPACGGRMVDVRSIARYIASPAEHDTEARKRKYMLRNNVEMVV